MQYEQIQDIYQFQSINEKRTLTIGQYIKTFKITDKTARTDLKELESKAFVEKIGETKGAFFRAKTGLPK